jgi:hypothetical protein
MLYVRIKISRYVETAFPGWVECSLIDAVGQEHLFVEKLPVVTDADLDDASSFPCAGVFACVQIRRFQRDGRQIVSIDTQSPWGIEATTGKTQFDVWAEQLCDLSRE